MGLIDDNYRTLKADVEIPPSRRVQQIIIRHEYDIRIFDPIVLVVVRTESLLPAECLQILYIDGVPCHFLASDQRLIFILL